LFEHVLAPLADLPVREIISATHILTDLTLSPATVIYDYLTDSAPSAGLKR
jgi:acetoacetate decarboxylase